MPWQETARFNLLVVLGFALTALTSILGFPLAGMVWFLAQWNLLGWRFG